MENTNPMESGFSGEAIYTVVRNVTKNSKVVLSALGGVEIGPGETVNLKQTCKRAQLVDAAQQIEHFIRIGALADVSNEQPAEPAPEAPAATAEQKVDVRAEVQKKIREARSRDMMNEITGSSNMTRLEDIILDPSITPECKRAAKVRYMQLRGWVDDNGVLIEGSTDDENQDITSIDSWEFSVMKLGV